MSGNIRPQSSQLAEPLWTDPGVKSGNSVRELISTSKKKKKKAQAGNGRTFSQNPHEQGKSHHHRLRPRHSQVMLCVAALSSHMTSIPRNLADLLLRDLRLWLSPMSAIIVSQGPTTHFFFSFKKKIRVCSDRTTLFPSEMANQGRSRRSNFATTNSPYDTCVKDFVVTELNLPQ